MNGNCPLCDRAARRAGPTSSQAPFQVSWKCETCGTFRLDEMACRPLELDNAIKERRFLLSAYAKEGFGAVIDLDLLDRLAQGGLRERTVAEKTELVLRYFADKSKEYGQEVTQTPEHDYPTGWCRSPKEWTKLIDTLARERELLKRGQSGLFVTMKGWEWLESKPGESGRTAFVAMNFAGGFEKLREAIQQAIGRAGYDPIIIDQEFYTGGVMDRVLASIREARFVVADYTGNRGGVYYEAGFALGLGRTVIHSCSQAQLDSTDIHERLHFDVAHLHMIRWEDDDLSAYSEDLKNHIEALLGHGPVKAAPAD